MTLGGECEPASEEVNSQSAGMSLIHRGDVEGSQRAEE
jgi:hypothetical protein